MPTSILLATTNPGKVSEMAALLAGLDYRLIGLADLPSPPPPVEETGSTFRENALLKAVYYHEQTGYPTLADDSGLAVDALNGSPGVLSARYGGKDLSDARRNERLLKEMRDVPVERRTARFICCLALIGEGIRETFEGACEGTIALTPRGDRGFGYDPIFVDPESGSTFAELTGEEKSRRSHRGQAMRLLREYLRTQG